ncbi:MAG: lipopolysaccharide heptosyltransferase I [Sedimentisphaerales bacterium]|nr:lipopolysaccharide heptosyltransferase I [Sedimentisphaerales bacterium]
MQNDFRKILIIKPSALGDIIQALPALSALRRSFPQARINWLVRPEFAPLIEGHPDIDNIIHFDRKFLGKAWRSPKALKALRIFLADLRRTGFDAVFDFQGLFRTAFFAYICRSKNRFGMAGTRELAHFFYNRKVPHRPESFHLVDHYIEMVRIAGGNSLDVRFGLPRNAEAEAAVEKILEAESIPPKKYVVLVPGSAHPDKCWPTDRFAQLADKLAADHDLEIIATGTKAEAHLADRIGEAAGVKVANLAGKTSIVELVALLRNAALVVSNDTGPGHIAAALGRPIIMIFGRTNPARVAPYGRPQSAVAVDPFSRGSIIDSPNPVHDIRLITLDDVLKAAQLQMTER